MLEEHTNSIKEKLGTEKFEELAKYIRESFVPPDRYIVEKYVDDQWVEVCKTDSLSEALKLTKESGMRFIDSHSGLICGKANA